MIVAVARRLLVLGAITSTLISPRAARAIDPHIPLGELARRHWTGGDGLPSATVTGLALAPDGYLWVLTSAGLARFDGVRFAAPTRRPIVTTALALARGGTVWVGGRSGLAAIRGGMVHSLAGGPVGITALVGDLAGRVWLAAGEGVFVWDGQRVRAFGAGEGLVAGVVRALGMDRQGKMFAAGSVGLAHLEGDRWVTELLGEVHALAARADGGVWAATTAGVMAWPGDRRPVVEPAAVAPSSINVMLEDRDASLWVGSAQAGLWRRTAAGALGRLSADNGLASDVVRALVEDDEGGLWVGTLGGGLQRLAEPRVRMASAEHAPWPATGTLEAPFRDAEGADWFVARDGVLNVRRSGRVQPVPELGRARRLFRGRQGDLWAAGETLMRLRDGKAEAQGGRIGRAPVKLFYESAAGHLYLATNFFVVRYAPPEETWLTPFASASDKQQISCLHEDADGVLWVGTLGGGLRRLRRGQLAVFRGAQGLPSDTVYAIAEDLVGRLWLSTSEGIAGISKVALEEVAAGRQAAAPATLLDRTDGVVIDPSPERSSRVGRDARGQLWFATARGAAVIEPGRVRAPAPRVVVEELRAGTQKLDSGKPVPGAALTVVYTAFAPSAPERLRFRHRLAGLEDDWVDAGTTRRAEYRRVPAGSYRFEVMAVNGDGIASAAAARLSFVVAAPFYRRAWFVSAGALGLAAIALAAHRLRLGYLRREYQAVLDERARLARDIHDTLAQTFVAVSVQLDCADEQIERAPAQARAHLARAHAAVSSGLTDARRSVQALRVSALERGGVVAGLWGLAEALTGRQPIEVRIRGDARRLVPAVEEALLRAAQEALTNALRHARASSVTAELAFEPRRVSLTVRDDGVGFPAGVASAGQGMAGMRERLERVGGRVTVDSSPGGGTVVRAEVPA